MTRETPLLPAEEVLGTPPGTVGGSVLGRSREGREILGYRFGRGAIAVGVIAGCHADEPVGPALLEHLVSYLAALPAEAPPLTRARWSIVPHANPDGRSRNAAWSEPRVLLVGSGGRPDKGYDLVAHLDGAVRELPGDDVEFGFPRDEGDAGARPENRAIAAFLAAGAPFHLHASLHGMAFADGPWFLLEPSWAARTQELREALARRVDELGYRLSEVDRRGEKGFRRISRGFSTRPDSRRMAEHFHQRGDDATAALFRPSSMELARRLGGDPLTLVSEMPLFLVPALAAGEVGAPPLPVGSEGKHRFVAWAARLRRELGEEGLRREAARMGIRAMPVGDQMRLQLALLEAGIAAIAPG